MLNNHTNVNELPELVDIRPVCAGCGKPLPFVSDGASMDGGALRVSLRVDWRSHAMRAVAMLRKPGEG